MMIVVSVAASVWIVALAGWRGVPGDTTEGRRDKSRRCAPWFGRVFSGAYRAIARGAPDRSSLRTCQFSKDLRGLARCVGLQP
jgi:hypothetical protein